MTLASEMLALAAELERAVQLVRGVTEQTTLMGAVFDYNAPLPPMPNYRGREWETD